MVAPMKIYNISKKYRRFAPPIIDFFIALVSYILIFTITGIEPIKPEILYYTMFVYAFIYLITLYTLRVYKNMWRYTSIVEIFYCITASIIANFVFFIVSKAFGITVLNQVFIFVTAVSTLLSVIVRVSFKALLIIFNNKSQDKRGEKDNKTNVMMVGAGQATSIMLGEIKSNPHHRYSVKCIVDDDHSKIGRKIFSIPIVGNTNSIHEMSKRYEIKKIIISIPSIDTENKKRIVNICTGTNCKVKILPEIYSLMVKEQKDLMGKLRDVQVEDLLGREPITLDCQLTNQYITNKTVLVTGGGGSIGSELCRQIACYSPMKLIILDIYENNAYYIQQELIRKYGDILNLEVQIASVRDKNKLEQIFQAKHIDVVFHAAAHKHVPLMEDNPEEAIKNNIIGTYNTVFMADKYRAKKFVLISTDKAVNPTNVMGATKRVCEMIIQAFNQRSSTDFVAVRFGNVLGSNGSVIPLFMEQIKAGGPVTITHKQITRYFMTIPEAVQLVLKASVIAKGGEIFVLDMGEPVKIKDLAYNLIRLAGLIPDKDIKVEYTGLRPGEKLYEELLITDDESQVKTEIEKIFVERCGRINDTKLFEAIISLDIAANKMDLEKELMLIEELVPSYRRTPNYKMEVDNDKEKANIVIDRRLKTVV